MYRPKDYERVSRENIMTPQEFRGMLAAMVQAMEASTFRIKEQLRTGLPLNLDLIGSELMTIERVVSTTLEDVEKVKNQLKHLRK